MNRIKFIKPVYPDDELHTVVEVLDKKPKNIIPKEEKVFEGELSVLVKQ
ncbi:uncharacterized protein S101359_00582 [Bacillus atrophaeus]|nr:uncharacterized protein S101359_00582 [Bacillus atrophaeus]